MTQGVRIVMGEGEGDGGVGCGVVWVRCECANARATREVWGQEKWVSSELQDAS